MEGEYEVAHAMIGKEGSDGLIQDVMVKVALDQNLVPVLKPGGQSSFKVLEKSGAGVPVIIGFIEEALVLLVDCKLSIQDGAISSSVGFTGAVDGSNSKGNTRAAPKSCPAPAAKARGVLSGSHHVR